MSGFTKLLDAVTTDTDGDAFEIPFPYLNYGVKAQVSAGADVDTYSVAIQGRTDDTMPWVTLATVTQASDPEDHLVTDLPVLKEYKAVLTSYTESGDADTVDVGLSYVPQAGTVMTWVTPLAQQDSTPYPASQSWPEDDEVGVE